MYGRRTRPRGSTSPSSFFPPTCLSNLMHLTYRYAHAICVTCIVNKHLHVLTKQVYSC